MNRCEVLLCLALFYDIIDAFSEYNFTFSISSSASSFSTSYLQFDLHFLESILLLACSSLMAPFILSSSEPEFGWNCKVRI
jgi:hypothetical protein